MDIPSTSCTHRSICLCLFLFFSIDSIQFTFNCENAERESVARINTVLSRRHTTKLVFNLIFYVCRTNTHTIQPEAIITSSKSDKIKKQTVFYMCDFRLVCALKTEVLTMKMIMLHIKCTNQIKLTAHPNEQQNSIKVYWV